MEIRFEDYQEKDNYLSFSINEKEFTGICGNTKEMIINILFLKNNYKGKIYINKKEINSNNINNIKKKIVVIEYIPRNWSFQNTIYELMYYEIRRKKISLKNPKKKIIDSLRIVGLEEKLLRRNINTLSSSEKKKLQLSISLLTNPDIIIIEEPFKFLDKKNEKQIYLLLQKIKEQYKKTIVFVSDDVNILYKYTNHLIISKNNKILIEGNTKEIFKKVSFLNKNKINIPEIVLITYLAKKKKNVKIDYHTDIRDIIKDIYKHV